MGEHAEDVCLRGLSTSWPCAAAPRWGSFVGHRSPCCAVSGSMTSRRST